MLFFITIYIPNTYSQDLPSAIYVVICMQTKESFKFVNTWKNVDEDNR